MNQKRKGFAILLLISSFSTLYLIELANTAKMIEADRAAAWGFEFLQFLGVVGLIITAISFIGFIATFFFMEDKNK